MRFTEHFWEPVSSYSQMSSKYENMILNYVIQHRLRSLLPTISPPLFLSLSLSLSLSFSLSHYVYLFFLFSSSHFTSFHFTSLFLFAPSLFSSCSRYLFFSLHLLRPFSFVLVSSFSVYLITLLTDVRFHQWPPRSPSCTFQNLTS